MAADAVIMHGATPDELEPASSRRIEKRNRTDMSKYCERTRSLS